MALSKVLFLIVVLCLIYLAPARPRVNTCKNGKCASGHGHGIEVTKREEKLEKRALNAEDEVGISSLLFYHTIKFLSFNHACISLPKFKIILLYIMRRHIYIYIYIYIFVVPELF
jgi:hypothetical protein